MLEETRRTYYERRAADALACANAAASPLIANIHLELVRLYVDRARSICPPARVEGQD